MSLTLFGALFCTIIVSFPQQNHKAHKTAIGLTCCVALLLENESIDKLAKEVGFHPCLGELINVAFDNYTTLAILEEAIFISYANSRVEAYQKNAGGSLPSKTGSLLKEKQPPLSCLGCQNTTKAAVIKT